MTHTQNAFPESGECAGTSVLLACEDPLLLRVVERAVSWRRPGWLVHGVVGPEEARSKLGSRGYDLVVVCLEDNSRAGTETLSAARTLCPEARRIVCSATSSKDPEVLQASEHVSGPGGIGRLVDVLDRALKHSAGPAPSRRIA